MTGFDRAKLNESEVFWRDHQKWLQTCGYMLRPRYMPDWKASWLTNPESEWKAEDRHIPTVRCSYFSHYHFSDFFLISMLHK